MSQPSQEPRRTTTTSPPRTSAGSPTSTPSEPVEPTVSSVSTTRPQGAAQPPTQGTSRPASAPTGTRPGPPAVGTPAKTGRKGKRRHARVVIRKIGPWSVFKISLLFYTCLMLVLLGAGVIIYGVLGAIGALESTQRLIRDLFADQTFVINGRWLFTRGLWIGLAMVVLWSLINVFVVFLYNLVSDLIGGVEVTLAERR